MPQMSLDQAKAIEESKKKRNRGPLPTKETILPEHQAPIVAPTSTEAINFVDAETKKFADQAHAAEKILIRCVRTGERWSAAEQRLLEAVHGPGLMLQSQLARVTRALQAKSRCRGPSHFNRIVEAERAAIALYEREFPPLEAELARVHAEIASLQTNKDAAAKATNQAMTDRVTLFQSSPPIDVEQFDRGRAAVEAEYRDVVTDGAEINWRRAVAQVTENDSMVNHIRARTLADDDNLPMVDPRYGTVDLSEWQRYVQRRRREADAMQPQWEARKAERDLKIASLQAELSYYYRDSDV